MSNSTDSHTATPADDNFPQNGNTYSQENAETNKPDAVESVESANAVLDHENNVGTDSEEYRKQGKAFTIKSISFGLLALLFTILYADYNDFFLGQTSFVANHLPPGPLFLILGLALIWNPMWSKRNLLLIGGLLFSGVFACFNVIILDHSVFFSWHLIPIALTLIAYTKPVWNKLAHRLTLSSKELILALCIVFAGCWTAAAGLNNFFTHTLVGPWALYNNNVQQHKYETIHYIPSHLWPGGGLANLENNQGESQRIYDAFYTGYTEQGTAGVPWDAWMGPLLSSWIPMLVLFSSCLIAMSLIVHRQWAHHEQLSYPLAQIGTSLLEKSQQRILPNIFYAKSFWIAAGIVIVFHGIRYLHTWWPNNVPDIITTSRMNFFWELFPTLNKSGGFGIVNFNFYFSIIGICYFLSREIGLTIGLSQLLLAFFGAQVYLSTGTRVGNDEATNMRAGAYIAYAAIILFTGRHYYINLFAKAIGMRRDGTEHNEGVYAARVLIISFVGLLACLCFMFQLDFYVAVIFTLLSLLLFLVFTRIICETGIPYMQAGWQPAIVMTKVLGTSAVGAAPLVMIYYLGAILFSDPKEAMMPYISNSFKMADDYKIKLKKLCHVLLAVVAVAVLVSICARIYQHYSIGAYKSNNPYGSFHVPNNFLNNATRDLTQLDDIGHRDAPGESSTLSIIERIGLINADEGILVYMFAGAFGVALFFFLRFRFIGFPLHPVLFLIWGTYPNMKTFYAFLVGWFIREIIVRFGGGKIYQDCKPFFIGLIFGELLLGITGVSVGFIYHAFTDFTEKPPGFKVIAG